MLCNDTNAPLEEAGGVVFGVPATKHHKLGVDQQRRAGAAVSGGGHAGYVQPLTGARKVDVHLLLLGVSLLATDCKKKSPYCHCPRAVKWRRREETPWVEACSTTTSLGTQERKRGGKGRHAVLLPSFPQQVPHIFATA